MEKKQFYAIFLGLIMISSIYGFSFFLNQSGFGSAPNVPPEGQLPDAPNIQDTTALSFSASGIDANVVQIFPTMFITASTQEAEIAVLEREIINVEGIERVVNSFYRQPQQPSFASSLIFVAELQVESGKDPAEILQGLRQLPVFSGVQAFPIGLVSLPEKVTFRNDQLNLTQEHVFADPKTRAFLNIGAMPGDNLKISLEATIAGTTLRSVQAFEEINLTAAPLPREAGGSFTISEMKPALLFEGTMPLSDSIELQGLLREEVEAIEGVESAELDFAPAFPRIEVLFEESANVFEYDLNILLSDFNGVTSFDFDSEEKKAGIMYDGSVNYPEFKQELVSELNSLKFTVKEVVEPNVSFGGTATATSSGLQQTASALEALLNSKNASPVVWQSATINASSIMVDEEEFLVASGSFEARVLSSHSAGDSVTLTVFFQSARGSAENINAFEATETEE